MPALVCLSASTLCCLWLSSIAHYLVVSMQENGFQGRDTCFAVSISLGKSYQRKNFENLSQSALCCFTTCELKHDFSNNSLRVKIFFWHCLACLIHLSVIKESQHSTGLLLFWVYFGHLFLIHTLIVCSSRVPRLLNCPQKQLTGGLLLLLLINSWCSRTVSVLEGLPD